MMDGEECAGILETGQEGVEMGRRRCTLGPMPELLEYCCQLMPPGQTHGGAVVAETARAMLYLRPVIVWMQ